MATTTPSSVPTAVKVLVTGPPTKLSSYFSKLATLQAKHSFDLVLALDLFSGLPDDDLELAQLMAGVIEVPKDVQLYAISGGRGAVPNKVREAVKGGGQVTERLSFLGKTGVLTLASGLRLATFAGSYEPELFKATEQDPDADLVDPLPAAHFTSTDLESFRSLLTPAQRPNSSLPPKPTPPPDILLTTSLPASLPLLSALALPATAKGQPFSSELDEVVRMSRPRYHFIGGTGIFWEREPFQWNDGSRQVCRSICLGEMGAKGKERAFYAFSIVPGGPPPNPLPTSMTPSPYSIDSSNSKRGTKRPAGSLDQNNGTNEYGVPNYIFGAGGKNGNNKRGRNGADGGERRPPPEHYTCNICEQMGHWIQDCPEKVERDAQRAAARAGAGGGSKKPIQPDECWFCLSNPKVTKHLIASIGSETYLTLPKGQLCPTGPNGEPNEKSPVPGGGHVLIIPVRTTNLDFRFSNELTSSLWSTLQIAHYPTLLSVPADQAVPIVAEIERYKSALKTCYAAFGASPVAFEVGRLSGKGGHAHIQAIEQVFIDQGQKQNVTFKEASSSSLSSEGLRKLGISDNYFRVDLPNGKTLVHSIEQGARFGLQFGREALAVLMELPERADWKACSKNEQMEKKECVAFKKAFKNFDPME
ncbi:BQ5605_C022g09536 [Microbotryum silenes-dioicae]|uniref:BQ5605_C022g09536 protein n=1 Tax=Microbotryum silenes-dioicae TaxID=796604 RepID=A0A2X0PLD2_9BASI|nr:BQ5605_C022g09536 [Microbotryum silenes-dioicae]